MDRVDVPEATIEATIKVKRQIMIKACRCIACGKWECPEYDHEKYQAVIFGEALGLCESCRKVSKMKIKLLKKLKRKHYNLRSELAKWVEKNIGTEYVAEALEKYDKINEGVPIGGMAETVAFIGMVETVKAEVEGR